MALGRALQFASIRLGRYPGQLFLREDAICSRIFYSNIYASGSPLGMAHMRDMGTRRVFSAFPSRYLSGTGVQGLYSNRSVSDRHILRRPLAFRSWVSSPSSCSSASRPQCPVSVLGTQHPGWGQAFHSSPRRPIHPLLWVLIKPVAKLGVMLGGRRTQKWWRALSEEERAAYHGHFWRRWYVVVAMAAMLGATAAWYYESHMEETPITGRRRFVAFTHDQFIAIVEAEAEAIMEEHKDDLVSPTHPWFQRVERVARRLVDGNQDLTGMVSQQWKIAVIQGPDTNAFVMPTGHIFVYTGLLEFVENDDQLGIVLGHEMAHALLSHAIDKLSYAQWIDFFVIAAMAAIWLIIPSDGIAIITQWFYHKVVDLLLHMPYSRQLEKEADKVGLQLAAKACFDVREGPVLWNLMHLHEKLGDPDARVPEWLSTHPSNETRVELLNFLIPKALDVRESCQCPRLPPLDPWVRAKQMTSVVDNALAAKKAGQNLQRLTTYNAPK